MEKIKSLFRSNPKITIGLVVVLALSLPFVINQVLKEQDIRQGAQSDASISFSFSPATKEDLKVDDTFVVTLKLNAGAHDVGSLSYKLEYDASKLEFTDGATPSPLKILTKSTGTGSYSPTYFNPLDSAVTGNGMDIHTYTFKAKANGEAKISITDVKATAKGVGSYLQVDNATNIKGSYVIGDTSVVDDDNLLKNGSLSQCATDPWVKLNKNTTTTLAAEKENANDTTCFMKLSCGADCGSATLISSVYQDITVTDALRPKSFKFGGKFGTTEGTGKVKVVLHATKEIGGGIAKNETIDIETNTTYKEVSKVLAGPLASDIKFLRFEIYMESAGKFKADDMYVEITDGSESECPSTDKENGCVCTQASECKSNFCNNSTEGRKICGVNPNLDTSLTPPTNLKPSGTIDPGEKELTWDASPKATGGYYIRIHDITAGHHPSTDCPNQKENDTNLPKTGAVCRQVTDTSYDYNFIPGHQYHWWVHTRNTEGKYGEAASANVTAKNENPPSDTCTAGKNRNINCACTEDTQCRSNLCSSSKCAPKPTETVQQGHTGLKFSVKLPGIGQKLVNNEDNQNPLNSGRMAFLQIFNDQNGEMLQEVTLTDARQNQAKGAKRSLIFNTSTYNFEGQIDLGTGFTTGSYTVKLAFDNTLRKQLGGIVSIIGGKADNTATLTPLTSGDLNQDNTLGVFDWTYMIACIKNENSCTADLRALADLNDNGVVDEIDVQLLQRGFAIRNGD